MKIRAEQSSAELVSTQEKLAAVELELREARKAVKENWSSQLWKWWEQLSDCM